MVFMRLDQPCGIDPNNQIVLLFQEILAPRKAYHALTPTIARIFPGAAPKLERAWKHLMHNPPHLGGTVMQWGIDINARSHSD
jgi:hypothetical protein